MRRALQEDVQAWAWSRWSCGIIGRRTVRRSSPLPTAHLHPALVNGAAGVVVTVRGRPFVVMGFTVAAGKIVEIDVVGDPDRVRRIAAAILPDA